jgi:hypothetical protein
MKTSIILYIMVLSSKLGVGHQAFNLGNAGLIPVGTAKKFFENFFIWEIISIFAW